MRWRMLFIEWPAKVATAIWTAYLALLISLIILAFTGAALSVVLHLLGLPIP